MLDLNYKKHFFIIIPLLVYLLLFLNSCDDALNSEDDKDRIIDLIGKDTLIYRDTIDNDIIIIDTIIIDDTIEKTDTLRDTIFIDPNQELKTSNLLNSSINESYYVQIVTQDSIEFIKKTDEWFGISSNDQISELCEADVSNVFPKINLSLDITRDPNFINRTQREEWINSISINAKELPIGSGVILSDKLSSFPIRYFELLTKNLDGDDLTKTDDESNVYLFIDNFNMIDASNNEFEFDIFIEASVEEINGSEIQISSTFHYKT